MAGSAFGNPLGIESMSAGDATQMVVESDEQVVLVYLSTASGTRVLVYLSTASGTRVLEQVVLTSSVVLLRLSCCSYLVVLLSITKTGSSHLQYVVGSGSDVPHAAVTLTLIRACQQGHKSFLSYRAISFALA